MKFILVLTALCVSLLSFSASADVTGNYVIPEIPMDADAVTHAITLIEQFMFLGEASSPSIYAGKTPTGQYCDLQAEINPRPRGDDGFVHVTYTKKDLDLNNNFGGDFLLHSPDNSANVNDHSYLIDLSEIAPTHQKDGRLEMTVANNSSEIFYPTVMVSQIYVTGHSGSPSSFQFGVGFAKQAAVNKASDIYKSVICSGLTRVQ